MRGRSESKREFQSTRSQTYYHSGFRQWYTHDMFCLLSGNKTLLRNVSPASSLFCKIHHGLMRSNSWNAQSTANGLLRNGLLNWLWTTRGGDRLTKDFWTIFSCSEERQNVSWEQGKMEQCLLLTQATVVWYIQPLLRLRVGRNAKQRTLQTSCS